MSDRLYTLRAIARELALPESTVRYYRDAFAEYLPTAGRGRRRRHPAQALPLFRLIADAFAENRSRDEIRDALVDRLTEGGAPPPAPGPAAPVPAVIPRSLLPAPTPDDLLGVVLDGERERREVMWQMAREIVRLGEAIERQHAVLSELVRQVERRAAAELLPPADGQAPSATAPELTMELDTLRSELARERELVERLRRSKLEIERRAAEAEAALSDARDGGLRRLFGARARGTNPS